ncbi:MAG: hypothetical protein GY765_33590 [bacterium]|nr:hypothetical protein [bacterium]
MNKRKQQVGIDRLIRLKWLQQTADLVLAGNNEESVKHQLFQLLAPSFPTSSSAVRGSLDKTITVLMKTWVRVHPQLVDLKNRGIQLLQSADGPRGLALHWGMLTAAYPFWGAVAGQTGRLLRLQEDVAVVQLQRRLKEQYGERETVSRRVRYVVSAFVDWGVLAPGGTKGIYHGGKPLSIDTPELIAWLLEATLHAHVSGTALLKGLLDSTALFPFRLGYMSAPHLASISPHLQMSGQGQDDTLLIVT